MISSSVYVAFFMWLNILLYSWQVLRNILSDVYIGKMWMMDFFVKNLDNCLIKPAMFL